MTETIIKNGIRVNAYAPTRLLEGLLACDGLKTADQAEAKIEEVTGIKVVEDYYRGELFTSIDVMPLSHLATLDILRIEADEALTFDEIIERLTTPSQLPA